MREYSPKKDVQAKAYYSDRFYVTPQIPKEKVSSDAVLEQTYNAINEKIGVKEAYIQKGHLVCFIDPNNIREAMTLCKNELGYKQLMELCAVDFLAKRGEFELIYELLSMSDKKRMRIKCVITENQAIESVSDIYRSADWSEREMFDMSGVKINNHPYMKRILMPDDWSNHPLRKDYPLFGDEAAQWYEIDKIFGKEHRAVVGAEERDAARVDRFDTDRFARIKHEVAKGEEYSDEPTDFVSYQEKEGVLFVTKFDKDKSEQLGARK